MVNKTFLSLIAALLLLPCANAFSQTWAGADFTFGSLGYKGARASFSTTVSSNSMAGMELRYFSLNTLPDVVYAVKAPITVNNGRLLTTLRPLVYPSTKLINTSAMALGVDNTFLLDSSEKDQSETLLIANVAGAMQNTLFAFEDGTAKTAALPQMTYELGISQHYYREFYLTLTGTVSQYMTGLSGVTLPEMTLDQGDMGSIGMSAAMTRLPLWTMGIDIMRKSGDDKDSSVILGYRYITFKEARTALHALTLGARMKVNKNSTFEFSYNLLATGDDSRRNFYRIFLNMGL